MSVNVTSRKGSALRWTLITLFIIWLAFAISSFFVVNKPVDANVGRNLAGAVEALALSPDAVARALLDLGAVSWITVAAAGIGLQLYNRILIINESDALSTLLLSTGLGFGVLGFMGLALGLLGLMSRPLWLVVLGLLTLITVRPAIDLVRQLHFSRPPVMMAVYLLPALGMMLTLALLPPTSWDALFYHLKGPKLFMQTGIIRPGIDIPHLNFPSLLEMLFMLAMQIRGDVAARLVHLVFGFLLSGIIYLFSSRSLVLKNPWRAVLFLYGTPLVLRLGAWAYNDLALAYYALAALFALAQWRKTGRERWLLFCGALAGLLMGLKYTSVVIVAFIALAIIWRGRHDLRGSMRPLLLFVTPAAALVFPWLLKNWFFTGNPVYPFLFEGRFWDDFRAAAYSEVGTGIGVDPIMLLRLPYDMTLGYTDASQEGTIGPLYLLFLPLFLFYARNDGARRMPPVAKLLLAYALFSFLFWTFGVINSAALWQARLFLPGAVALCPVMAWIMEDLIRYNHPSFSLRRFLGMVLAFVFALLLLTQFTSWLQVNPVSYLSATETRDEYLFRRLGAHYQMMETINAELPADATVLFLWEPRSYYCDIDCRPDSILDRFAHQSHLYPDASAVVEAWRNENVTHVLIFDAGLDFLLSTGADIDETLLNTLYNRFLETQEALPSAYTLYQLGTEDE